MFKKNIYLLLSIFFNILKFIKTKILKWGYGDTFVGYLLEKTSYNYLADLFKLTSANYIFVTGTNGKTSTTSLFYHFLSNLGYSCYTNKTGSNLYRGILSFLLLNYFHFYKKNPDYIIIEVDEGSVPLILKSFPKKRSFNFVLLNLSRDQLDRFGEIDILANNIISSLQRFNSKQIAFVTDIKSPNLSSFSYFKKNSLPLVTPSKDLVESLNIKKYPHLVKNLSFVLSILKNNNINVEGFSVPFSLVEGRGSIYKINNTFVEVHLTKNPKSFDNNLKILVSKPKVKNVLILVNDFIPDGRDVSWFYDIDRNLLKKTLEKKNTLVGGSRSLDFCNMLNIYGISYINIHTFKNLKKICNLLDIDNLFVLSNYSATQEFVKFLKKNV